MDVKKREQEILDAATPKQKELLTQDIFYGAPYSFWSDAVFYGLATKEEKKLARNYYKDMWHYRGD